jgi:hypothetical protein
MPRNAKSAGKLITVRALGKTGWTVARDQSVFKATAKAKKRSNKTQAKHKK